MRQYSHLDLVRRGLPRSERNQEFGKKNFNIFHLSFVSDFAL